MQESIKIYKGAILAGKTGMASLVLMLFILLSATLIRAENLPETAEKALLRGDWAQVLKTLDESNIKDPDAVCRMIVAHSCLALNRNSAALRMFWSLRDTGAVDTCLIWSENLVREHPENAIAQYLHGDALARTGRFEEAIASFDRSLVLDSQFVLSLSAKGVVKAMAGDLDEALYYLRQATQLRPDFADAHANLGTVYVLLKTSPGAIAAFNRAVAADSSSALAYNGRGCAQFAEGNYDSAMVDLEKAFELCPILLPAGANEAMVLAALAEEATPSSPKTEAGTTITSKSELANMDLVSQPSAHKLAQFEQSVQHLFDRGNYTEAFSAISAQRGHLSLARQNTLGEIGRLNTRVDAAKQIVRMCEGYDAIVGLIPTDPRNMSFVPDRYQTWKSALMIGQGGVKVIESRSESGSAANLWSGVASRTLTPEIFTVLGAYKALSRVGAFFIAEGYKVPQKTDVTSIGERTANLQWNNVCEGKLQQLQSRGFVQAINNNFDFTKMDVLGLGRTDFQGANTRPVREYSIPSNAPLTQFNVLPGATGKSIAPAGQQSYVLVEGADLTDPLKVGAAVTGYNNLNNITVAVPKGVDGKSWMRTLGLPSDRTAIVKITGDPFNPQQSYSLPKQSTMGRLPPGGVTTESKPHIDRGDWPVVTGFTLSYPAKPD